MARMPQFIRQILRQTDSSEEDIAARDKNQAEETEPLDAADENAQNRGIEANQSFWQSVVDAGEAADGTPTNEPLDAEARIDGNAGDQAAENTDLQDGAMGGEAAEAAPVQTETAAGMNQADATGAEISNSGPQAIRPAANEPATDEATGEDQDDSAADQPSARPAAVGTANSGGPATTEMAAGDGVETLDSTGDFAEGAIAQTDAGAQQDTPAATLRAPADSVAEDAPATEQAAPVDTADTTEPAAEAATPAEAPADGDAEDAPATEQAAPVDTADTTEPAAEAATPADAPADGDGASTLTPNDNGSADNGFANGNGQGNGNASANGQGNGNANSKGHGNGNANANGHGNGNANGNDNGPADIAGSDQIVGGTGNDTLKGADGDDDLSGGAASDILIELPVERIIPGNEDPGALEVIVSRVPEGLRLTEGTDKGDRTWSMTVMQLAVLAIAIPAASSFAGEAFALNVEVSRQDADGEVVASAGIEVDARAEFNQAELVRVLTGPAAAQAAVAVTTTATQSQAAAEAAAVAEATAQSAAADAEASSDKTATTRNSGSSAAVAEEAAAEVVETVVEDVAVEQAAVEAPVDALSAVLTETIAETVVDTVTETAAETGATPFQTAARAASNSSGSTVQAAVDVQPAVAVPADVAVKADVAVQADVSAPDLTAAPASGNEDSAIALDISSALVDGDNLSVTISGIPTGAALSAGTDNGDGTWTLTSAQLSGLSVTPASNDSDDFTLTVTATSTDGASTAQSIETLAVSVSAVADTPSLSTSAAAGNEDGTISLSISSALTDSSESLSVVISGVPTGASLSAGTDNGDGSWTLTSAQLSGLSVTPAGNDSDDFTLTVTATSTDGASTAQSIENLAVSVGAVADAPSLSAGNVTGSEDTAISLSLSAALTDTDGSESLGNVTISGVPVGTQFSAGTNNGDGTWSFTSAQLSGLTLTPPPDRDTDFTLSVAVTATDGSDTATSNGNFTVTINPVADTPDDITLSADAVDENASNGTVVGSASGSDPDTGETFTYSLTDNAGGRFSIDSNSGQITVADGSLLDFESAMSHDITIRVTDSTGNTYDETKAITLNDLSEYGDTHEAEIMANGPVAFWRLGESSGTSAVDEISGANGTYTNSPTLGATGPFGNIAATATDFNGATDYVSIPDSTAWDLTDGSLQLWFNAVDASVGGTLLDRDGAGTNEGEFYIDLYGGDITVNLEGTNGGLLQATNVITSGVWVQLTVTFGANGLEIYVDGTRVAFDAGITGGIDGNNSDLTVGSSYDNAYNFEGQIAEVAIFDSQLTEASIDGLYSAGATGTDLVTLTAGADVNAGTSGEDFIAGAAGNDTLSGAAGDDRLYGDGGDDTLNGGDGADILMGGDGADNLFGDALADVLSGGDGDDILTGGTGADTLLGGAGSDTASYAASASAVNVNLTTGAATGGDAQGVSLTSIENLTGSAFNDGLIGDGNINILTGGAGDDTLQGLGGGDTLYGGLGSDTFIVGEGDGNDIIDGGAAGGWTDSITLQNADASAVGSGWTLSLTSGSEVSDVGSVKTLSSDAAGTITLEDGTQIAFQNIESIVY